MNSINITVFPKNICLKARRGRTILDVLKETSISIPHECDGKCTCGTCYVTVEQGMENLSPKHELEDLHLEKQSDHGNKRLACQARILGEIVIRLI